MTYNHPRQPLITTPVTAGRDAKFCVSRAMAAYFRRHIITHTHCADLIGRRKILHLYFSYSTNYNQHFSPIITMRQPVETQNLASHEQWQHTSDGILLFIHIALTYSGDARFCVSTFADRNLLRNNLTVCSSCLLHNTAIIVASAFPRCSPLLFQYKHKTGMTDISSKYG